LTNLQQLALSGNKLTGQYFGGFIQSFLKQAMSSILFCFKSYLIFSAPVLHVKTTFLTLYGKTGVKTIKAQLSAHLPKCKLNL
jgi:hypothetical protein